MRTLCWSIKNCWAPGTTSWSLDCSSAIRRSNPLSYTTMHRWATLTAAAPLSAHTRCCCYSSETACLRCSRVWPCSWTRGASRSPSTASCWLPSSLTSIRSSRTAGDEQNYARLHIHVPATHAYQHQHTVPKFVLRVSLQHCAEQLVVCGPFNGPVGSLQTAPVTQSTVRTPAGCFLTRTRFDWTQC